MVKHSSSELRIVTIDNDSRFKAMLNDGQKIKGKVKSFYPGFLVSEKGDTINYNEIGWIKLQRELTRFQEIAALSGLLLCGYLSLAAIPAAMYLVAVEANYAIILLPVATVTSAVVGLKLLTGRRYQLGKWTIQSIELQ